MADKKVVHYRPESIGPINIGHTVFLQTFDHPGPNVTNWPQGDGYVGTSQVVRIGDKGEFETLNTIYRPYG